MASDHGFTQHVAEIHCIIIGLNPFPGGQLQILFNEGEVNPRDRIEFGAKLFLAREITAR